MKARWLLALAALTAAAMIFTALGAGADDRLGPQCSSSRPGAIFQQCESSQGRYDGPTVPTAWRQWYYGYGRYGYGWYGAPEPVRPWYPPSWQLPRQPVIYHWYAQEAGRGAQGNQLEFLARPSVRQGFSGVTPGMPQKR